MLLFLWPGRAGNSSLTGRRVVVVVLVVGKLCDTGRTGIADVGAGRGGGGVTTGALAVVGRTVVVGVASVVVVVDPLPKKLRIPLKNPRFVVVSGAIVVVVDGGR